MIIVTQTTLSTGDPTIEWELDVTESSVLLSLAYIFPSILGGVTMLVFGLVAWLVASAIQAGDFAQAAGILLVALLAILSRRYLPALLGTTSTALFFKRYSLRGLIAGSVLGALVLLGSTRLHPDAPFAVFIASWAPLVLTAAFPTNGHADVETRTLVVDGTEVPLEAISQFRTVSHGAFTMYWISYSRGAPTAPRIIFVPTEHTEMIADLVDATSSDSNKERSTIGRSERLISGLFGIGLIAMGPVLWLVLPPGDGQAVALYAGVMFGLFGMMLLWYAYSA